MQLNENVYGGAKHLLLGNQWSIQLAYLHLVTLILPLFLKRVKISQIKSMRLQSNIDSLVYATKKTSSLTFTHSSILFYIHDTYATKNVCICSCVFVLFFHTYIHTFSFLFSLHFTFAFAISYQSIHPSLLHFVFLSNDRKGTKR